ncbi:MAG: H+-transporting two-sector ATPase, subunit [Bryobacterales bacterium]|nr:H+-transporting two-sector ATPase, subunit [Bryobacterales bacterium]
MKRLLLVPVFAIATLLAQEPAEHKAGETAEHSQEPAAIWKWANFAILAAGLGYLMAKNLPPVFTSRTKEIQKGISEAQQMKLDAERRAAEMDARLKALGADIERFRDQSAAEMQQEGDRIARETAAQLKKIEEHAAVEIESAGKTARRQLKEYAAELALGLAEERLRSRLDSATEAALVDDFVRDLERQGSKDMATQKTGSNN